MNEFSIHDHQLLRDLHIDPQGCVELAEASDAFDETRQLKRELLASRQEAEWEREKRMEAVNLIACYEYDRWIILGVTVWALVATIAAVCLWRGM